MRGIALVALVMLSMPARAAGDDAPRLYGEGKKAYDAGRFDEAYDKFKRAYLLSEKPELLFNMALALEGTKRPHDSADALRAYLRVRPDDPDRGGIEGRIAALEEKQRILDAERGPKIVPPAQEAPKLEAPSIGKRYRGGFIMLGLTGAIAIAWAGTGGATVAEHQRLKSSCGDTAAGCSTAQRDGLAHLALASDVLMGVTIAAAITTVVLFAVEKKRSTAAYRAHNFAAGAWSF
jgi:tetratricopeptide (TPR) repeat protein